METRQDGASAAGQREPVILEMTPRPGEPLKEWLGLALTRFALGGVTVGQVIESWMASPPREVVQESQPAPAPAAQGEDWPSLPPMGHPLQVLGARLTDLLAEDHWNNVEPMLLDVWRAIQPPAASQGMREAVEKVAEAAFIAGTASSCLGSIESHREWEAYKRHPNFESTVRAALSRSQEQAEAPQGWRLCDHCKTTHKCEPQEAPAKEGGGRG